MSDIQPEIIQRRVDAALGRRESDWVLRGVRFLDVFSCSWWESDVAIQDGIVVGVDSGYRARREVDARGKWLVPGFIDAHVHVESSMMMPDHFSSSVLRCGTTSAVCDPHELANVLGIEGIRFFLDAAQRLKLDLWVMLSSCVPATHLETNGGGTIDAAGLLSLAGHSRALGLAEMMNMPGVLHGDPGVLEKLASFSRRRIDGHCPMLRGQALSAYAAAGISSCHESSELEEAREKLLKGIAVWIREGSVAKDLDALVPLLNLATSTSLGFCTDDRNPLDIATEGHVDHLLRRAIAAGVAPEVAYRSASWSVARHYGLDLGPNRVGAIAPGYVADLVLLDDAWSCAIHSVYKKGESVAEMEHEAASPGEMRNTVLADVPEAHDLKAPSGRVHVIDVIEGKIITGRAVLDHDAPGVARLSVLERHGRRLRPANAYVRGFGESFRGAIASSVGHDSHNLIVVGKEISDMRIALAELIRFGGGFCVVKDGTVSASLPLPFGGLMSSRSAPELQKALETLKDASRAAGCALSEPFLQLAFLSLPVIPSLKLTDRGLVDVDRFDFIDVRA